MNKKITTVALAASMLISSSAGVFAAPYDISHIENKDEVYALQKLNDDTSLYLEVAQNKNKYTMESQDGRLYLVKDVDAIMKETGIEHFDEAIELLDPVELEEMTMKIGPKTLIADGKTVMEVEVRLNTPNINEMGGMLEIHSKLGLKASKVEEALDKGVAKFTIQLPTSVKDLEDVITVTVKSHDVVPGISENELVGKSISKEVTYKAMGTEGTEDIVRRYKISDVRSLDMADRVAVYVGMENKIHLEEVKESIVNQVKLYNGPNGNTNEKLDIIKVQEVVEVDGGYAFISLIDLKDGKAENVLHDNQYNYYAVEEKSPTPSGEESNISLDKIPFSKDNRFMLIDGKRPEVRLVKSTKNDGDYLPNDSILVEFNEPVNKETAENPKNWVINGKNLGELNAAKSIELIDVKEAYPEGKEPKWTAIAEGKERNSVIIQLKPSFARNNIKNGQDNLLQVKSVADWAGLTDKSDNNKISTQEFKFFYNVPEVEENLSIEMQSPEQFVLELGDILYTDNNAQDIYDLTDYDALKVKLKGKDKNGGDFKEYIADYEVRALDRAEGKYILELTKDWTKILDGTDINAYHGKTFEVSIENNTYNAYGEEVTKAGTGADDGKVLSDSVVLEEDVISPFIESYKVLTDETTKKVDGQVKIKMNEPVQLKDRTDNEAITRPNLTPQLGGEFSEQIFEYVKVKDSNGKVSKGIRVEGKVAKDSSDNYKIDEYDMEFVVEPMEALSAGEWKLVVRAIPDDVGNTMKTEQEITFTIEGIQVKEAVDPYLVWGYAIDDKDSKLDKDYVVLLFSREMDIDVLRGSTYNINGKKIDQDAKITDDLINAYANHNTSDELHGKGRDKHETNIEQWVAHRIVIELPKDFIVSDKDTNALTLPMGLKAIDDGVEITKDSLLGGTQFELDYENYANLVNDKLLPAFDSSSLAKTRAEDDKAEFIIELKLKALNDAIDDDDDDKFIDIISESDEYDEDNKDAYLSEKDSFKNLSDKSDLDYAIEAVNDAQVALDSFDPVTLTQTGTVAVGDVQYTDAAAVIAALPTEIEVTLVNGSKVMVPVTWEDTDSYDSITAGEYTFTATWGTIPTGANDSANLTAPTVTVTVAE